MNPWEVQALNYGFPDQGSINPDGTIVDNDTTYRQVQDPVIYPGLYSASGYDIMAILLRIVSRPNPTVHLGPIDCSVSLVVCDLNQSDAPIIYATEAFTELTGYASGEVLGYNCRLLQTAPGKEHRVRSADKSSVRHMRHAIRRGDEVQERITNYKRNGQRFTNLVSIIPVPSEGAQERLSVGFMVEVD